MINSLAMTIPASLRERPQWVAWKSVERDGKSTKVPVNPHTGELGKANDKTTWGTFEQALEACRSQAGLSGVGFVFSGDDPYCGIDLDDCIDPATGVIKAWGTQLIEQLASYSEVSPSGTGVKVFVKANKPGRRCRKAYHDGEVEIYDCDRFFTVTGQRLEALLRVTTFGTFPREFSPPTTSIVLNAFGTAAVNFPVQKFEQGSFRFGHLNYLCGIRVPR